MRQGPFDVGSWRRPTPVVDEERAKSPHTDARRPEDRASTWPCEFSGPFAAAETRVRRRPECRSTETGDAPVEPQYGRASRADQDDWSETGARRTFQDQGDMKGVEGRIAEPAAEPLRTDRWDRPKRQAPVLVTRRNRRQRRIREASVPRAGRAGTRVTAPRSRGHRIGQVPVGVLEQFQVEE
jgi:hypothetical protein